MLDTGKMISKAKASLIIDQPFFAALLLPMPLIETREVETFETDGESIWYSPDWIEREKLTQDNVLFVLAHEVMHCVLEHSVRRGSHSPNRWNQACDYAVNQLLVNEKIGVMPKVGLLNPDLYKRGGGTAEGIYKILPENSEKNKTGAKGGAMDNVRDIGTKPSDGKGKDGQGGGQSKLSPAEISQKAADLKVRIVAAKNAAKMQGKLSAGLERLVSEALKPKVDWVDELRRFFSLRAKIDFSFAKPKRRFLSQDLYLPSLTGERLGKVVYAVDCSGSITDALLNKFTAEIKAVKEDLNPEAIEVIYFDSQVCGEIERFEQYDELVIKARGGGGTAFSPVIQKINEMEELPVAVVFLTDLECDDFGPAPDYPVLWCVLEGKARKVPYGEVLEVSKD